MVFKSILAFFVAGTTETTSRQNIKVLANEFTTLPSQAIPCYLSDVHTWPSYGNGVRDLLQGKTFNGTFTDMNLPYGVVLRGEDGEKVGYKLKELGCEVEL